MGICYCEEPSCHKIFSAAVGLVNNPFDRPVLPCGHRLSVIVFSAVLLRENAVAAEKLENLKREMALVEGDVSDE